MGKVVPIRPPPRVVAADDAPVRIAAEALDALREFLAEAEAGDVAGFALVWTTPDGEQGKCWCGPRNTLADMLDETRDELAAEAALDCAN